MAESQAKFARFPLRLEYKMKYGFRYYKLCGTSKPVETLKGAGEKTFGKKFDLRMKFAAWAHFFLIEHNSINISYIACIAKCALSCI